MADIKKEDLTTPDGEKVILTDLKSAKPLGKTEIEELVKKVSRDDVNKAVELVEGIDVKDLNPMTFSIFDFIGFDPFAIISVIKIICDHYKDPEKVMLSDIRFCIAACLYMGNIQAKALTKRSTEGRTKIEYLAQKYQMEVGSTGTGMTAETVTFPRVAASFPVLAIKMAYKIPPKAVNLEFQSTLVPSFMRLTPFASLCSSKLEGKARLFLMEACNAHSSDMSIAYEKGRLKQAKKEIKYDPVQLASDQWGFVTIASESPVPEEAVKKTMLLALDIPSHYENLEKVVRNYRAMMSKQDPEKIEIISRKELENSISTYSSSK